MNQGKITGKPKHKGPSRYEAVPGRRYISNITSTSVYVPGSILEILSYDTYETWSLEGIRACTGTWKKNEKQNRPDFF